MSFNELLSEIGEFGVYQKLLCFGFLLFSIITASFTYWSQVLIFLVPPHRCRLGPNDIWESNISEYESLVARECDIHLDTKSAQNLSFLEHWTKDNSTIYGLDDAGWKIIPCPHGWVYDFSVYYPTISSQENWVCEDYWKMYTIHTCYWIGAICGYATFGVLSDRLGRRRCYQISVLMMIIADVSTLFPSSHVMYSVTRMFSAMGRGSTSVLSFLLVVEYTGPKARRFVLGVWCLTWTFTSAFIPIIPYLLRRWRWIQGITIIPSVIVFMLTYYVPESASWLITKGRLDKAANLLHQMASVNGKNIELNYIKQKLQEQNETFKPNEKSKTQISSSDEPSSNGKPEKQKKNLTNGQAFFGLFKTPNLRKKTILLAVIWMIASGCYNGNNIETANLPFNIYLLYSIGALLELPSNIFCLLALDKVGRRWANFCFCIISGTLALLTFLIKPDSHFVFILAMLIRSSIAPVLDISFTFASESLPTEVRGCGVSIIRILGGISSAVAPLVVSLSKYDAFLPLGVFGFFLLFAAGVTLFIPETARQHLPQTLEEGEAFGKNQNFCFCPLTDHRDSTIREVSNPCPNDQKDARGTDNRALEMNE